jgi:hypothetical protein
MLQQIQNEIRNDPYYQQNFANEGEGFVAWYLRRVLLRDAMTRNLSVRFWVHGCVCKICNPFRRTAMRD